MDLATYLNIVEKRLQNNFDLYRNHPIGNYKLDLFGKFSMTTERYILTKRATIDTMENNEYCFIKYFNYLNIDNIEEFKDFLIGTVERFVEPSREHMHTAITGVVVVDKRPSDDIIEEVKSFRYHKSFAFGFKGWVDISLILVTMKDNHIVTNKKGRRLREVYQY